MTPLVKQRARPWGPGTGRIEYTFLWGVVTQKQQEQPRKGGQRAADAPESHPNVSIMSKVKLERACS